MPLKGILQTPGGAPGGAYTIFLSTHAQSLTKLDCCLCPAVSGPSSPKHHDRGWEVSVPDSPVLSCTKYLVRMRSPGEKASLHQRIVASGMTFWRRQ